MSTVVIAALGSRGDVAPLTGVGIALQRAGHRVVVAAFSAFADLVTGCGLEFRDVAIDLVPDGNHYSGNALRGLASFFGPAGMRVMSQAVIRALSDTPADVMLLCPLSELAGHPLCEARGIPSIGIRLQPLSATSAFMPSVLGAQSFGPAGNRLAGRAGSALIDHVYHDVISAIRSELGLPFRTPQALRAQRCIEQWPILHGYSPAVLSRPPDWRQRLDVVGYWWPAPSAHWQPPAELLEFLAAGPAPVGITFGSLLTTPERARHLGETIQHAVRLAGVRAIVQTGWTGIQFHAADDILTIGDVPHEWLFPRLAAVAHHCGAGTTAAALRAGVPTIAMPNPLYDQPFWARRLQRLEASVATIWQPMLSSRRLASALRAAVSRPEFRTSTRQIASRVNDDDGAEGVVTAVERALNAPARSSNRLARRFGDIACASKTKSKHLPADRNF